MANYYLPRLIALCALPCMTAQLLAAVPSFSEAPRTIPGMNLAGLGGIAVADFDGDGKQDIAVSTENFSSAFFVIGETQTGIGIKQSIVMPDGYFVRMLTRTVDGTRHLVALSGNGEVREYAGWPLTEVHRLSLNLPGGLQTAAIGDIDHDNADDLVVVDADNANTISVYDYASGQLRWSLPHDRGRSVLLAQLDADPALEVVVDGYPLIVIDGATQATEWFFDNGYYECCLAAGHFQDGSVTQFVSALGGSSVSLFHGFPYALDWSMEPHSVGVLAAADLDQDGYDELLEGDLTWGGVKVLDTRMRASRFDVPNNTNGVRAIAGADIDGNQQPVIAFASAWPTYANDNVMKIADGRDGSMLWQLLNAEPGPYAATALVNTDDRGREMLYYASLGSTYTMGSVSALDADTGALLWRSAPGSAEGSPFAFQPHAMLGIERAGAAPLLVVGGSTYDGHLVALDASDHHVVWQTPSDGSGVLYTRPLVAMAAIDFGNGQSPRIGACLDLSLLNDPSRLVIFSSEDGSLEWESDGLAVPFDRCVGITAGTFIDGAPPLVVALLTHSIQAFDAKTHAPAWTLPIEVDGASILAGGVTGREFVVFRDTSMKFYDAATRALLRQFEVPGSVTAVLEPGNDIHRLLVAAGDRLLIVDGADGTVLSTSDVLGQGLGAGNQLAMSDLGGGAYRIGVGNGIGVFRLIARMTDALFANGFD